MMELADRMDVSRNSPERIPIHAQKDVRMELALDAEPVGSLDKFFSEFCSQLMGDDPNEEFDHGNVNKRSNSEKPSLSQEIDTLMMHEGFRLSPILNDHMEVEEKDM
ncbi:hypothetical protein QAD02_007563 [Eretmocerus hayati]|uniref:Uncharacterized protein n=1 Tax=Eretmocerus hayati TaxID=131215 RepID=A0ACC2N4B2_9HYME|nr:hypothetical protein QAD02_007563 [Eretmocerus hayati]